MRYILLAGVALGAVSAFVPVTSARADSPAAVFPVTSSTDLAGWNGPQLNGAAPGSVQVNLGGRTLSGLWFEGNPSGTPGWQKAPTPQFNSWFFLYPGFDYASPSGVHFGAQAEVRVNSSPMGVGAGAGGTPDTFFIHEMQTYVSSDKFGKLEFGIPSGAMVQLAVGTGDDFGEGLFFSWYGTNPYIPWVMGDSRDNYTATQKVVYITPSFGGLKGAISYQPTPNSLSWNSGNTYNVNPATYTGGFAPDGALGTNPLLSKNRVSLAVQYAGTFSGVGVKANGAYDFAEASNYGGATVGQNVSMGNVGAQLNIAGFELEGSAMFGKWNPNIVDDGNPGGPLPVGAKGSTAFVVGAGYGVGPIKVGAVYYHVSYDEGDFGGPMGKTGYISGPGVGASYSVGPGVVLYADVYGASFDTTNPVTGTFGTQHPFGADLTTFFSW